MAESIQPIKPLGGFNEEVAEAALSRRATAPQTFTLPPEPTRTEGVSKPENAPKNELAVKVEPKKVEEPEIKSPVASPFQNVHLKFKVDPDTNDVTVMMVDNASHRVVRTIPPDELRSLKEGDLVQLLA